MALSVSLARVLGIFFLALPAFGHGGAYRGPDGAGPGASGPGAIGPLGPTGAAGAPGTLAAGALSGGGTSGPDLTQWSLWWRHNGSPYLALKEHVRASGSATGSDGWFLGEGEKPQTSSLGPTVEDVRGRIVPALLAALDQGTDNDLVTGAMVALAKIGDDGSAADFARFERALVRRLSDPGQEIRETAAVALGVLGNPRAIPTLAHLLWDTREGRALVRANEVDYRTRSFAAYGLGLCGARAANERERMQIVALLRRGLERDDTKARDLEVACLVALGLVPLATIDARAPAGARRAPPPESSRCAQLDYVLAVLRDERREVLARAQCPVTLARLLAGLPEPHRARYREEIAGDLIERIARGKERAELLQSCIVALGLIGTNDGKDPLDGRIRRALEGAGKHVSEPQARAFALIAAAEVGGRFGAELSVQGIDDAREHLVRELLWGKNALRPWAALACGILSWRLQESGVTHPALESLERALRGTLADENAPDPLGALALATGLARSRDSAPRLMKLLEQELEQDARGHVAVALALLGHGEAVDPLRRLVERSKYRPELLRECAIALGILGDKDVVPLLARMLGEARSLAAQSAIATALGFIGDRRSVDALLALLSDRLATDKARAFAAVALGNVADKEPLPWNAKIALDLNYRAAPSTLTDPLSGKGILDLY